MTATSTVYNDVFMTTVYGSLLFSSLHVNLRSTVKHDDLNMHRRCNSLGFLFLGDYILNETHSALKLFDVSSRQSDYEVQVYL